MLGSMARKYGVPVVYVNQFGGNDDLVFDGRSCAFDADGHADRARPLVRRRRRHLRSRRGGADRARRPIVDAGVGDLARARARHARLRAQVRLLTRGARAVRRHRLGADRGDRRRRARRRQRARRADAVALLEPRQHRRFAASSRANLGIETLTLPIEPAMQRDRRHARATRSPGPPRDVTEENIQARIRGNLLMALSNKRGALLLTTGNKSELSVGYCTLYGDMSGGLGGDRRRAEDDGVPRRAMAERDARARGRSRKRR